MDSVEEKEWSAEHREQAAAPPAAHGSANPRGGGEQEQESQPVDPPGPRDSVSGRGLGANQQTGSVYFRDFVAENLALYLTAETKSEKTRTLHDIVRRYQQSGGRFLRQDDDNKQWYLLTHKEAMDKVGQRLRVLINQQQPAKSRGKKRQNRRSSSSRNQRARRKPPPPEELSLQDDVAQAALNHTEALAESAAICSGFNQQEDEQQGKEDSFGASIDPDKTAEV